MTLSGKAEASCNGPSCITPGFYARVGHTSTHRQCDGGFAVWRPYDRCGIIATHPALYHRHGDAVGQWVADRACDGRFYAPLSLCIGLMRGERLVAGAIFDHYNHRSIHLHMAIERLTPTFLSALAHYAFDVAGVETVIAPVTAVNRRSRRAVEHAGFTLEATLKNIHPSGDVLYYTLHRDACPFSTSVYTSRLESYYGR